MDQNGNKVIEVIILLLQLMSMMVPDDRHRLVINQRLEDVLAKGVLQKYEKACNMVKELISKP